MIKKLMLALLVVSASQMAFASDFSFTSVEEADSAFLTLSDKLADLEERVEFLEEDSAGFLGDRKRQYVCTTADGKGKGISCGNDSAARAKAISSCGKNGGSNCVSVSCTSSMIPRNASCLNER